MVNVTTMMENRCIEKAGIWKILILCGTEFI